MKPALSLYLDALRLAAAFLVLVSHLGHGHLVGGSLWRFTRVGNEAVMLFFVLSGFVIAVVADRREHSLTDYAAARLSRLYSVVLPALLLTVVLDAAAFAFGPSAAVDGTVRDGRHGGLVGYLLSLAMLSQSWGMDAYPGSNAAYWSVPYEFWYYTLFGAWLFLAGASRWLALAGAALLAGPQVLALLPVWLCGVAAYRWQRRFEAMLPPRSHAAVAVLCGTGVLAMLAFAAFQPPEMKNAGWSLGTWPWQIASFSLYLIHLPVLHLLHALMLPVGTVRGLLMIGVPLLVAGTFGHCANSRRCVSSVCCCRRAIGVRLRPGQRLGEAPTLAHFFPTWGQRCGSAFRHCQSTFHNSNR